MNVILDGEKVEVPPVSTLNCRQFIDVIIKSEVYDLNEYIALFSDMPLDHLMDAKIPDGAIPIIHNGIYDINIDGIMRSKRSSLNFNNEVFVVDELSIDTFGKAYLLDLYHSKFLSGDLNFYELSVYGLACSICPSSDMVEVNSIYDDLIKMSWIEVLPVSFFLAKKLLKRKKGYWTLLITCILELKKVRLRSSYLMIKSNLLAKR